MDRNQFSQFEKRIQALIEGGFARLFTGRINARDVALELARAMEDNAEIDHDAVLAAPNHYIVLLYPGDHAALLKAHSDLDAQMAAHLVELARESELRLDALPQVTLAPSEAMPPHTVKVEARYVASAAHSTQVMPSVRRETQSAKPADVLPAAYLVVDGDRYVPLLQTVVTIGRRRDNAIVVDDPRVSRQHAQLRFRFGRFVVYDLGSRGGTQVNGTSITECVLRPNDVISLAGAQVVYVEDEQSTGGAPARGGDTQLHLPSASEPGDEREH